MFDQLHLIYICKYRMEEDQELIKKLMNLLGSGKEIKFKSPNGQTIKVSLDGNSYNQTQASLERAKAEGEKQLKEPSAEIANWQINEQIFEQPFQEQNFSECLKEISTDFNALSRIKEKSAPNESIFNDQSLQHLLLMDIQKLNQKESGSSLKNQDHVFKEIISEIEPKLETKPKKISLKTKSKQTTNEPVIDFFKEQQPAFHFGNDYKHQTQFFSFPGSSPVISRVREDLNLKSSTKSETIHQNITLLKERHPQDEKAIEMISERLYELEQRSKIMDQSISILNSSISNNISMSMGLQSFQLSSMLSFKNNLEDPLCYILSQFIKKAKQEAEKKSSKSIPSSFLFMYSQPLVNQKREEIQQQINYFEQQQIIQKTLKQGKCKVDYIHQPATIEKLHYWIKQGIEILHFCGHGVQSTYSNYLLFENERGQSENVNTEKLAQILKERINALKLVFVASCHSQSAGKVFSQAGANHVICVRDEYQILDQACEQFVKLFYLTCINSKTTICESFYFAKKQLQLKGKFTKHECQKFIIIADHKKQNCEHYFEHRNQISNFNDLSPHPSYNKYLLSRVEHYVPRCKDMYEIIKLIGQRRRYITILGQSGIGKSTFVRELVRYLQFRNYFKDGVVYLELRGCENMSKLFEILDLELFQTPQLKLNKSTAQNAIRLVRELNEKNLLFIFDNCQNIMASEQKDDFKKFTEHLMKNCKDIVFIFTNRHSIGRQIDYCSQKLYELEKLNYRQSKTLFFNKIPRNIKKKEFQDFFNMEHENQNNEHPFFNFLNGHPEAICLTASLLADRSLKELYEMLLKPNISEEMNYISEEYNPKETINRVVSTAIRISLNVINHKYKDASMMLKMLSLLPNGADEEMMGKLFPQGGKWKDSVKKLINHSLVQCIEKGGFKYYALHPHIIIEVEKQMSQQEKMKYHEKLLQELVKRIRKIYEHVGTLSQMSNRQQQIFLFEQENFKTVLLRELSFLGEKYPLRKFYENIFKVQFEGLDEEEEINDIGDIKFTNAQILASYEKNKKVKALQAEKNAQKKEALDLFIVYYLTILFVVKKVKTSSVQTYINYGLIIAQKRNKYLIFANLCRIKACVLLFQKNTAQAKTFFNTGRAEFAQVGCGLGSACCEAAIGYIKYCQSEYASAKMNLQNALKYYDQIPHPYGKHYLNRWLCSLKAKMNKGEKQLFNHKLQAQKLLKQAKLNLRSNNFNNISLIRHKLGVFPFRFLFDNMSLFLQATFEIDLRPKFINTVSQYVPHSALYKEKDVKKNNFILDEINEEPIPASAVPSSSGITLQKKMEESVTVQTKNVKSKQVKEVSKRTMVRKSQKPNPREIIKQYEKYEKGD